MAVHAYTSFSFSYLNKARVLARSIKRFHPEWIVWAVITDKKPKGFRFNSNNEPFDEVVFVDELFGRGYEQWLFGHDIVEACTAVKGEALRYILKKNNSDKVMYFDPDTVLFNSMTPMAQMLDASSIVLTPHQVNPENANQAMAIMNNEVTSLDYGVFNLGFVAVKNDTEGNKFADWWADRLKDWCHDRLDIGVFVDQKWCNLVPCFFDRVYIDRDCGYNVASWNLSQRHISIDRLGELRSNDKLLRFFHFTKLGDVGDAMTLRYAKQSIAVFEMWHWYKREVIKASEAKIPHGWWYYGCFEDGVKIPKVARRLYRDRTDLRRSFPKPYKVGSGSYQEWLLKSGDLVLNN